MNGWVEPIEPPDIEMSHSETFEADEPQPLCACADQSLYARAVALWSRKFPPVPREPVMSVTEGLPAAAPQPRLWITFDYHDVATLNGALRRDGSWDVFHALGVMSWVYERVASIRLRVLTSHRSFKLLAVQPHIPSAMLGTPWSNAAVIRIATAVGASPWGLQTFCQVLSHEIMHWMGSIYGSWYADWHTPVAADLMSRAPARRQMWTKHDPATGVYYGRSLRELAWERTHLGQPLVIS